MHLHFLRAIGTAMSMRAGIAADTAAALLFRILSQPTLLFPPLRHTEGVEVHHEPLGGYVSSYKRQVCIVFFVYPVFISRTHFITQFSQNLTI
jgi:GIGANTEA